MTTTNVLETAEVDIAYDVDGPLPSADGRPPVRYRSSASVKTLGR